MKKLITIIATGFGLGYSPIIPGTIGTLPALFLAYYFKINGFWLVIFSIIGVFICQQAEKIINEPDPAKVVFDEIVGFLIAAYLIPFNMLWICFLCFRFFDMVKPFPINKLQELPGGLGIMADDIAAGIITNLLIHGYLLYFQ